MLRKTYLNITKRLVVSGLCAATLIMGYSADTEAASKKAISKEMISFDQSWEYAKNSKINSGQAALYQQKDPNARHITVCINAGHGTLGGSSQKTLCHPDGSPKVTSGTTAAGETTAVAVSAGATMLDGTSEAQANLNAAKMVKKILLRRGYDVLMIRETDDVQLDNIARTLIANNYADCHISIHYDSSQNNSGAFYCSVPDVSSYRAMPPVNMTWQSDNSLGDALIKGMRDREVPIKGNGSLPMDLTQTSYSTIPSVDLEIGDKASDRSKQTLKKTARGIADGIEKFF